MVKRTSLPLNTTDAWVDAIETLLMDRSTGAGWALALRQCGSVIPERLRRDFLEALRR